MKTLITPAYNSSAFINIDDQEFFLGKLIKKITNKVTAPTLKKVNTAIAASGADEATKQALTNSATQFQKAIVEDSPKGAVKGLALAASVVTLGTASAITAPALGKVAAAGMAVVKGDPAIGESLTNEPWPADIAAEQLKQQQAEELEATQATNKKMLFAGIVLVVIVIALILFR